MKTHKLTSALFLFLITSTSAFATDAASLQSAIQAYVGTEPGVVTVTASGSAFDVSIDIAPYLKKVTLSGFTAKVDPFKFKATPNADATWAVTTSGPWAMTTAVPDVFDMSVNIKDQNYSGTYSTSLKAFLKSQYEFTGVSMSQHTVDPTTKIINDSATGVEKISGTSTATDLGNGTADGQSSFTFTGLVSSAKMTTPPEAAAEGMPDFSYTWTAPTGSYDTTSKAVAIKSLLDLAAFAVSHPSKEMIVKDQAILKEKILAALPFFASVLGNSRLENVSVDTTVGKFSIASLGITADINGAVKTGRFAEGFVVSGLTLPDGLPLPPWSKGLVPTSLNIGFDVSGFDLETPVRKFITEADFSKTDPVTPGSEAAYLAAFAPSNGIKVTVPPGSITADLFTLNFESVTDINFAGTPTVAAKFSMKGMDAVIAQLQQAATDPTAQQAMGGLFAAKGLGKVEGDLTVWDVTMSADGKLLVNGTDLSAMIGAVAPPAPAP